MIIWSVSFILQFLKFMLDFCDFFPFFCFNLSLNLSRICSIIAPVDASTLPAELQRLLNTVRELDERSHCKALFKNLILHV